MITSEQFADLLRRLGHTPGRSDISSHVGGTFKGEETLHRQGREPGRRDPGQGRTTRDSTSINPEGCEVVDPKMRPIPPA